MIGVLEKLKNEEGCIYYVKEETPMLIVKTYTSSIKALISSCPIELTFTKKNTELWIGIKIQDIPENPLYISKKCQEQEEEIIIKALSKEKIEAIFINELDVCILHAEIILTKQDRKKVATLLTENHIDSSIEINVQLTSLNPFTHYFYDNHSAYQIKIDDEDEGGTFEQQLSASLISVFPNTLYRNPKIIEGKKERELTDILAYYKNGCFLIEAKDLSVYRTDSNKSKEKRLSSLQKQVKKAIHQLYGAYKVFKKGEPIYSKDGQVLKIDRTIPPHCIILVTELLDGDWSNIEFDFFQIIEKTQTFFHIMDLKEFIELLKASSGRPEIIDYNLMRRWECSMKCKTIKIKGEIKDENKPI